MNMKIESIESIETGYFYADGGAMFGAVPKRAWSRKYPSDEMNGCVLVMRSLLVRTENKCILVDTGVGDKYFFPELNYYRFFHIKDLRAELLARNVHPEEITDVVLTHLHFDHCGGCTLRGEKGLQSVFLNAEYWVSQKQWQAFCHPHPLEKDSFYREFMQPMEKNNQLRLLDTEYLLCKEVSLLLADGHTDGQIVPLIRTESETILFAGDLVPLMANLSPEWISAYDLNPKISYDEKVRFLKMAADEAMRIVYCHDAYASSSKLKETTSGLFLPIRESIRKSLDYSM